MLERIFGKRELSVKELEARISEARIEPGISIENLLSSFREGNWVKFVVNDNYNLILSTNEHMAFVPKLGISRADCLLPDGNFRKSPEQKIEFSYAWLDVPRMKHINKVAENKIKRFLESKSVEVK